MLTIIVTKKKDHTIENLLILDGDRYFIKDGKYEVVFKANLIEVSTERPHGLKYSLVLLNANGDRLIGFDNAHPAPKRRGPGAKKTSYYDHKHKGKRTTTYKFNDAQTLIENFWAEVDKIIQQK